ncbi:tuberin-like [Paramuricea clavata]|uniref:Tuberin-like n=1 Tax=Paramuricea clavata TaxID=317549 RepID=A0A7D9MH97_PARCT|nr:tuberin-like [Paramuricea clavata]
MPCAYCCSGRSSVSKNLPRVDNGSTSHARTGTKSTTADLRFVENEGSSEIKHRASFHKETITHQEMPVDKPSKTSTPQQSTSKTSTNVIGPPTAEPQTTSTESSQEQSRDSTNQCSCVCQGWAEFLVRRPTGNTSWLLRLQNRPKLNGSFRETPRPLVGQTAPQIYESLIPKQFFGK